MPIVAVSGVGAAAAVVSASRTSSEKMLAEKTEMYARVITFLGCDEIVSC